MCKNKRAHYHHMRYFGVNKEVNSSKERITFLQGKNVERRELYLQRKFVPLPHHRNMFELSK